MGSVLRFGSGWLVSSFVGAGVWAFSCPFPSTARPPRGWERGAARPRHRGWCRPGIPPKRHHTSARGYHGRCPSLPRWGRVRGQRSRRSDPREVVLLPGIFGGVGLGWGRWAVAVLGMVGGFGGGDGLRRPCSGCGRGEVWPFVTGVCCVVALRPGLEGEPFFRIFF